MKYKIVKDKFDQLFDENNIINTINYYNHLSYEVARQTEICDRNKSYTYRVDAYMYRNFKEKCELLAKTAVFSDYFIELEFNSLLDLDISKIEGAVPEFYIMQVDDCRVPFRNLEFFEAKPATDLKDINMEKLNDPTRLFIEVNESEPGPSITASKSTTGQTYNTALDSKKQLFATQEEYHLMKKAIEEEEYEALSALKFEKERILNEMEEKKKSLLAEVNEKKLILQEKMFNLNKEIAIMDAQIFDVQSYLGETYELFHIRKGKEAPLSQPLTINQKIRFLDEDLPLLVGLYGDDVAKEEYSSLMDAFKYSDKLVEYFCQTDKSITFFRLSKEEIFTARFKAERQNADDRGRYAQFYMKQIYSERGHDFVGFVLKNGENLYFGVVDEGKRVIVDEDIFCDIGTPEKEVDFKTMTENAYAEYVRKLAKERVARRFIFSILQGFFDNSKIIRFEMPINIFSFPPQVIFSSAAGRIESKIYGEFTWIKQKLNLMTRAWDHIFIHHTINDSNRLTQYFNYQPNIDKIHGLYEVVRSDINNNGKHIFVKTKRQASGWTEDDVNCHIEIFPSEYINIEYMNSVWIDYFISIKAVDDTEQGKYYNLMIKYWLQIREILIKREENEMACIKYFYPDLDKVENWQVVLSEWKLQQKNPVREITNFQAKRFAKALKEGNIKKVPYLYEDSYLELIDKKRFQAPRRLLTMDFEFIVERVNKYINRAVDEFDKENNSLDNFPTLSKAAFIQDLLKRESDRRSHFNLDSPKSTIAADNHFYGDFNSPLMSTALFDRMFDHGVKLSVDSIIENGIESNGSLNFFYRNYAISIYDFKPFLAELQTSLLEEEIKLSTLLDGESTTLSLDYGYTMLGNRDSIDKTIKLLQEASKKEVKAVSEDQHSQIIRNLIEIEGTQMIDDYSGFKNTDYAKVESLHMSPTLKGYRDALMNEGERVGVIIPTRPGYYDNYRVYDLNKLNLVYLHAVIILKRFKYGLAVDAINSYPFYRLKKS